MTGRSAEVAGVWQAAQCMEVAGVWQAAQCMEEAGGEVRVPGAAKWAAPCCQQRTCIMTVLQTRVSRQEKENRCGGGRKAGKQTQGGCRHPSKQNCSGSAASWEELTVTAAGMRCASLVLAALALDQQLPKGAGADHSHLLPRLPLVEGHPREVYLGHPVQGPPT